MKLLQEGDNIRSRGFSLGAKVVRNYTFRGEPRKGFRISNPFNVGILYSNIRNSSSAEKGWLNDIKFQIC